METSIVIFITPPESEEALKSVCDCSGYYGCRINGAILEGYMDGIMVFLGEEDG